jgi:serine/threonine-protein kinase
MDALFLSFQEALAGRYSIDREIGRGGMGVVYLAREVRLDRLVAIKLLPPDKAADQTLRDRFLREVRLVAKLSHPNIIPIHSVEEIGEFVFYVMAFIDGQTLTDRVRQRGPLAGSEGARVLREVAWALAYAHSQGFVHRDVKPDNILIEQATGRVLVADFGIAAAMGRESADGVTGTPEFMSPEQVLGHALDARSDIYGLGATGFFAVTGRIPFEGKSATEILAKHVAEEAPHVASFGMPVPRRLALIIDQCLMKDPGSRPQTADAVADHLSTALEQRKEMPAALRAFVKRGGRLNGGGTIIVLTFLLPVAALVGRLTENQTAAFGALLGVSSASAAAYLVVAARNLLRAGFAHGDLPAAFRAEAEQGAEELAIQNAGPRSTAHEWLKWTFAGSLLALISAIVIPDQFFGAIHVQNYGIGIRGIVGVGSMFSSTLSGLGLLAMLQQRRDIDTEFWGKVWGGRIGRAAFGIGKWFLGKRAPQAAMTHRPTELSLGLAAEQLFEALPKETRKQLGPVPEILQRLQLDAQLLRKQSEELHEAVTLEGSAPHADLVRARDSARARLADAVGALETIRLNLLRLHAGAVTVESFTTHLGAAAEVASHVERLIDASREADRAIEYPRLAASTPA